LPLFERLRLHVMAAERLHSDDTTVPVFATTGDAMNSKIALVTTCDIENGFKCCMM